jgi:membrane protein YqaA with SNARE-associated domain
MSFIRQIYDWVLGWADKPSGPKALAGISFAEASFFPIPPDVLLIPLALGNKDRSIRFGIVCSISSILGAALGYAIGLWIWWDNPGEFSIFAQFFFDHIPGFDRIAFSNIKKLYEQYNFMIIFTAGFTPIPFKLFTISAGAFGIQFPLFLLAGTISRSARFLLVAYLIKKFGRPITNFIDEYFNLLAILFTVLLFGGFFLIEFFL